MSRIYTLLFMLCSFLSAFAQGESQENPIRVSSGTTVSLLGAPDQNTTTWLLVPQEAFATTDLLTVQVGGTCYGDMTFLPALLPDQARTVFLTSADSRLVKYLWKEEQGDLYIAISQDNAGGTATLSFSKAKPGEVRQNALQAQLGANPIPSGVASEVWYAFTSEVDTMVYLSTSVSGNILDTDGHIFGSSSQAINGFRMRAGGTVCFCVKASVVSFTISQGAIPEGEYADRPIDITSQSAFTFDIPVDPNATTDGAEQSERYWLYRAEKSGLLMWGTDDKAWMEGMWGVAVTDQTSGKRLGTPFTHTQAGMLIYTVNVEAGHDYLISQVIGHAKSSRTVRVYVTFSAGQQGDSKDDPIPLTLGELLDMGRSASTTHYYSFTASVDGVYTAAVHAGGQVRATTPRDGSWNIGRDYSIQDRNMHIDDHIALAAGETLLLEVTLTSDIDIHTGSQDADVPNYSILITRQGDIPTHEVREGEDIAHAIRPEYDTLYDLWQSDAEGYYARHYRVDLKTGYTLYVITHHNPAISSPACVTFSLDEGHTWSDSNGDVCQFALTNKDGQKTGRQYEVIPMGEDRTVYFRVEGASFLYEGAQWTCVLDTNAVIDSISDVDTPSQPTPLFDLQGRKLSDAHRSSLNAHHHKGLYISGGKKYLVR